MILYKCHLFGINPPALASTLVAGLQPQPNVNGQQQSHYGQSSQGLQGHHSSAAWRAHELFQSSGQHMEPSRALGRREAGATSDCSMCANVERKFQCAWCQNQCQHQESCLDGHRISIGSGDCPPPRIDSVS